jgi:hypothetical protein
MPAMKKPQPVRPLRLSTKTLRQLQSKELEPVAGGGSSCTQNNGHCQQCNVMDHI